MLEVADIFRSHGPAWRATAHLSLGQLKVMSAIEQCRTAALGGHVLRCSGCEHIEVTYNSCLMGSFVLWREEPPERARGGLRTPFNSPLKLGPKHGDYLVGRPKRTPAQMRWDDRVEGFELLSWISASVDFSGR
jgi:Transposase zinc-binding domain